MTQPDETQFDFEWIGTPDTGDPLECRTWARLAWRLGQYTPTRAFDRKARSIRENIYVPLYPLTSWIVAHWWALLYEPWPSDGPIPGPEADVNEDVQAWLQRHCVRVANPGFATPYTCIFSRGRDVAAIGRPDPRGRYTQIPVEFTEDFEASMDRATARTDLARLVESVLCKLDGSHDERVAALAADWQAICNASPDEAEFCRAAGRLGLDPYDLDDWPDGVLEWFKRSPPGGLDSALNIDLLESPDPPSAKASQSDALGRIARALALAESSEPFGPDSHPDSAFSSGYSMALWVRARMGLAPGQPILDLREAAEAACGRALEVDEAHALPEGRVLSVVGWRAQSVPIVATGKTRARRESALRFLWSRGLYMALRETARGPRLVTDAKTWDQRASRAFAAELLAPREYVREHYSAVETRAGRDEADALLAELYNVSPTVIRHQVENVRIRWFG
mgnify:CR=1 FL=1